MKPEKELKVFDDAEALSAAAAHFIIELANKAVDTSGRFALVLSGGRTPEKLFALLTSKAFSDRMPWKNTFVFWGDERCVPFEDKRNNAHIAKKMLLDKVEIPNANIFPVQVNLPAEEAAKAYEQTIYSFFKQAPPVFDLVLLGVGEDGHTASLFPGTSVLHEKGRIVTDVYVSAQNMSRITMTAPLINSAANVLFLITGQEKATILNAVTNSEFEPNKYPAQLVDPVQGNLYWFADKAAASLLPE